MKTYKEATEEFICKKQELPSKTAFQQYLRNEKYWTYQHIADYTGTGKQEVWNRCNGEYTIRAWENRTEKEIELCETLYSAIFSNTDEA